MEKLRENLVELTSVGCWINTQTGMVFPCQVSGEPDMEFGVELEDTDVEWSKVLDKADIKVLADTLYNMWAAKQSKNKPLTLSDNIITIELDDEHEEPNDYGNEMSYNEQCYADRSDYANDLEREGRICPIQAAEMRAGA